MGVVFELVSGNCSDWLNSDTNIFIVMCLCMQRLKEAEPACYDVLSVHFHSNIYIIVFFCRFWKATKPSIFVVLFVIFWSNSAVFLCCMIYFNCIKGKCRVIDVLNAVLELHTFQIIVHCIVIGKTSWDFDFFIL